MSTVKSKKLQVGTDATSSNNFTIYQPAVPDGTLRIGVGNADNPTEVGRFNSNGYVATNAPAFSAYSNTTTAVTLNTWTKVNANIEIFDTNSCYDNSTNYRFTPTVAGYYQVNGLIRIDGTTLTGAATGIYKNGSLIFWNQQFLSFNNPAHVLITDVIYMNGTTDYVELYGYIQAASGGSFVGGSQTSRFSATLVRAV